MALLQVNILHPRWKIKSDQLRFWKNMIETLINENKFSYKDFQ